MIRLFTLCALTALAASGAHADDTTPPVATAPTTTAPTTTATATPDAAPDTSAALGGAPVAEKSAADAPVRSVAVLDLRATEDLKGAAKALGTLVTAEVAAHRGYRAISRGEIMALLAHQADQQIVGCTETQCLGDIGRALAADRVISGSLDGVEGGGFVFSLILVDPAGPTILERVTWPWNAPADDTVDLARPAVDKLLLGRQAGELRGALQILALAGAEVSVDDRALGATPLEVVRDLPIGVHRVSVRRSGYLPFDRDVAIRDADTTVLQVDLIDEMSLQPWYARWYVWGSALAAATVVGGTIAGVAAWQYLQTPTKLVVGAAE